MFTTDLDECVSVMLGTVSKHAVQYRQDPDNVRLAFINNKMNKTEKANENNSHNTNTTHEKWPPAILSIYTFHHIFSQVRCGYVGQEFPYFENTPRNRKKLLVFCLRSRDVRTHAHTHTYFSICRPLEKSNVRVLRKLFLI